MTTQYHTGLIFEPRALWDVKRIDATTEEQTVLFDTREAFMNGSRYPIQITEISLAPINYLVAANLDGGRRSGQAVFNAAEVVLAVRQRQNYSRFPVRLPGYSATPSQEPSTRFFDIGSPNVKYASGLLGVSHKRFDRPFVLPQYGAVEIQLSTYQGAGPAGGEAPSPPLFSVAWFEAGGLLEGSSRIRPQVPLRDALTPTSALYGAVIPASGEIPNPAVATNATFPPQHLFTTKEFRAQSPTAQGAQRFTGVTVQIDQIDYDNAFTSTLLAPMTPLALRTGCRVRTTDGGTKMDWWRPGAPIGLVLNTVSPAMTYRLPRPLTMEPGDQFEVELTIPARTQDILLDTYSIGVALNGYAVIEG